MPASAIIFFFLLLFIGAFLLEQIIAFLVSSFKKRRYTFPRLNFWVFSPVLALIVFLFSFLMFDSCVSTATGISPNSSDYEQIKLTKDFFLYESTLRNIHTDEQYAWVDSLYMDGDVIIASGKTSMLDKEEPYSLFRLEYKDNYDHYQVLDTAHTADILWQRYTTTHGIDRNEVKDIWDIYHHAYLRNFLITFSLSVLTTLLAIYAFWRRSKKRQTENKE